MTDMFRQQYSIDKVDTKQVIAGECGYRSLVLHTNNKNHWSFINSGIFLPHSWTESFLRMSLNHLFKRWSEIWNNERRNFLQPACCWFWLRWQQLQAQWPILSVCSAQNCTLECTLIHTRRLDLRTDLQKYEWGKVFILFKMNTEYNTI